MKCEHCGKNEATFFYKSSVNGHVTQVHLCQDCARAMGYTSSLRRSMRPMSLFGDDDFFSRPFSMLEPFLEGFGTRMLTEFPEPGQPVAVEAQVPEESAGLVDKAQQDNGRNDCRSDQYRVYIKEKHDSFPLFFLMISQHISRENICQRGAFSFSHLTGRKCARMINAFTLFI